MTMLPDSNSRLLGKRTFRTADQVLFARASGDHNPMHMDAVAARRLIAGKQVVHGVHVFFAALESLQHDLALSSASIDCSFKNPIGVGDTVCFRLSSSQSGSICVDAEVDGLVCTEITISTSDSELQSDRGSTASTGQPGAALSILEPLGMPLTEDPSVHERKGYRVALTGSALAVHFPRACQLLGMKVAAGIASLSYFVGMVCPGLNSVFSSFRCHFSPATADLGNLDFFVRKYDTRFRLVDVVFDGPIQGTLRAFVRPPAQQQETVEGLAAMVHAGEFAGTQSLIVGGSRGLGELTAKILAAGGGKVEITYSSGTNDARRIQTEIAESGKGECTVTKFDLAADDFRTCGSSLGQFDMVFYFATPRIFRKKANHFDQQVFEEFCFFYIERFFDLCQSLENLGQGKKAIVYLPSSVAITDRPRGLAEYSMAKAAAEVLADEINRNFRAVHVISTRLPRLSTDQTATIHAVEAASNVGTLLPMIRSVHAAHRAAAGGGTDAS